VLPIRASKMPIRPPVAPAMTPGPVLVLAQLEVFVSNTRG
jgi:hypothetical protein